MKKPLVSVCVPCFNSENFVGAALESVLSQTYAPIEIIVVNDGSTDRSSIILERYVGHGVKIIEQPNEGPGSAANRALSQANGDYIKFFDSDDLLHPEMIERQVRAVQGRTDVIAMGEWARFHDDPAAADFRPLPMHRDASPVDWLSSEWTGGQPMMQCAMFLIPTEILKATGGWDERLSLINDFEFFTRVLLGARELRYSPGAKCYYRSVPGSLSAQTFPKAAESAALSLILGTNHLLSIENSPRTRRAAANILKTFDYTFYPHFRASRRKLNARIIELGGSDLKPVGPPGFHRLRPWIGWRSARRLQRLVERLRMQNTPMRSHSDEAA